MMVKSPLFVTALVCAAFVSLSPPALADNEGYCARISDEDKYASDGYALTDAASILRQDRANYHKFRQPDQEDDGDSAFQSVGARERIPALLDNGDNDRSVLNAIVRGNPYVCVEVYSNYMIVYEG